MENLLDVRRKNHGTVVHSTIHYINVCEYNHVLPVQQPEQNRDSSYKELSPTQEQQQQESNTKLQNRQQQDDLSSQGFRQPETNPTVQIQDEQVHNTSAKSQLNQRRSHRRIYQTLKTALLKNCDDQLHQNPDNRRSNR